MKNFLVTTLSNLSPFWKKWWWLSLILIMVLSISITFTLGNNHPPQLFNNTQEELPPPAPTPVAQIDENVNQIGVLLVGYGGPGHQGGMLADVVQVLWVDVDKSQVVLISVPRDLWVPSSSGGTKINSGLASSGGLEAGMKNMKQLASTVTGLPINYVVAVDFVGFKRLVGETLGSIKVSVTQTLEDPWYPITGEEVNTCGLSAEEVGALTAQYSGFELERQFPCRYEHLLFEPGLTKMEGGDALKYVRSRHASSDFARSKRQHEVLEAIKDKVISLEMIDDLPKFFKQLQRTITTDFDLEVLELLLPVFKTFQDTKPKGIVLSTENVFTSGRSSSGQSILQPKSGGWQGVQSYIQIELEK